MRAAAWYGVDNIACPPQYLAGMDQIFRNSIRDRADTNELKLKAKPKRHRREQEQAAE
jgi:anthraniloyl-CoA monooxygenase